MATALHGMNGYAYWNGTAVALVTEWKMDLGANFDDITAMDSAGWRQKMAGIKEVKGSVTVRYATDDTTGQTIMRNNAIGGSALPLRLYPAGTTNYFSGSAFISLSVSNSFDSPVEATYDFESHGAWTYT